MAERQIPELDRKGLREFALVTGGIFAGLFGLLFPWLLGVSLPAWPWIVFATLSTWGLVAPMSLRPVYRLWMLLALMLSKVMTPLIMGIVFFVVITPVAMTLRLLGKDPLIRKFDDSASYRVPSQKAPPENLEKPY